MNKVFFYLLLFTTTVNSFEEQHNSDQPKESIIDDDYILCRSCGSDISSAHHLISKSSPISREAYNDTLFNKKDVLIQVLTTAIVFHFPVVTSIHSNCISIGEWENNESWFPGYRWKPCVCPDCGAYIGLVFEPINPSMVSPSKQFYGLVLPTVIGESCKYFHKIGLVVIVLFVPHF